MMKMAIFTLAVGCVVLAGELGRMVLTVACGASLYLAYRLGYPTGAEEREAAIVALRAPLK